MGITRRFPMRKISYYTALKLWQTFGVDNNRPFTCTEACKVTGRHLNGGMSALQGSGVIELTSGKKRSLYRRKSEPAPTWRFTGAFSMYMQTPLGKEELTEAEETMERILACA